MLDQDNQQRNSGYNHNLKIGAITVLGLTIIGMILGFWAGRSFTEMSQFVIFGLATGAGLLVFLWWVQKQPAKQTANGSRRPTMWVISLVGALIWIGATVSDWTKPAEIGSNVLWPRIFWIGGVIVFFLFALIKTKSLRKIMGMTAWDTELQPRDERERAVILEATERTYITGIFLITLAAFLMVALPAPSALAVRDLLFALLFLFTGLRNFYAWWMGLK